MIKLTDKTFKNLKENMNIIKTEIEDKRMNTMELQKIKNAVSKMKISLERININ